MTFDDDLVHLVFDGGTKRVTCKSLGLDWPPPQEINVAGFVLVLNRRSEITDGDRAAMTHVYRGAEYVVKETKT